MNITELSEEDKVLFCVWQIIDCARRINNLNCYIEQECCYWGNTCFKFSFPLDFPVYKSVFSFYGNFPIKFYFYYNLEMNYLCVGYDFGETIGALWHDLYYSSPRLFDGIRVSSIRNVVSRQDLKINIISKELFLLDKVFKNIYLTYYDIFNGLF